MTEPEDFGVRISDESSLTITIGGQDFVAVPMKASAGNLPGVPPGQTICVLRHRRSKATQATRGTSESHQEENAEEEHVEEDNAVPTEVAQTDVDQDPVAAHEPNQNKDSQDDDTVPAEVAQDNTIYDPTGLATTDSE